MNYVKYLMIFIGLSISFYACVEPEDPTEIQVLTGEWKVKNVIANGQVNLPDSTYLENSVLHLDGNGTFLFINVDGLANAGKWTATDSLLTLTNNDGSFIPFNIVYFDYTKLHVYYTFTSFGSGDVELRYLFERIK